MMALKKEEEKLVVKAIKKIEKLEGSYPKNVLESACSRYKNYNVARRKYLNEAKKLEDKLNKIRSKKWKYSL